jgi:hypothetical protein
MLSLESCWNYLRYANCDYAIVSLGSDVYDILSIDPGSPSEYIIENSPTHVVGTFPPGTDWNTIAKAADALRTASGEKTVQKDRFFARRWRFFKLTATRGMARYFGFAVRWQRCREELK